MLTLYVTTDRLSDKSEVHNVIIGEGLLTLPAISSKAACALASEIQGAIERNTNTRAFIEWLA